MAYDDGIRDQPLNMEPIQCCHHIARSVSHRQKQYTANEHIEYVDNEMKALLNLCTPLTTPFTHYHSNCQFPCLCPQANSHPKGLKQKPIQP